MQLCCPKCGTKENVPELTGTWWVTCNICGQVIKVVGTNQNFIKLDLTCPKCGYQEASVNLPHKNVVVNCPNCTESWEVSI
ncbi:MAG TPA: hypothetical protein PLZ08_10080 [Bacillota bacterium]|jgi:transcription elongation factor Elf1|nr:hypothetical protein [Bacillota bacterium]HOL10583.1 hypothetical protein [Bacillota bacterium]HPO98285.1 hypothetical protein [Bacillota bacterium]